MSALAKIKKTAAQHEQDRQYDKALALYARLLDGAAEGDEEVDASLYNRAGDLALRANEPGRAVTYFERALDLYAAGGFLNNAVALGVKILRHAPGHLAAHHTLGLLYARKGFRGDARQHLATYAEQMYRAGRTEEVRRALGELAAVSDGPEELWGARELLTARASGPIEAAELVARFDAAIGVDRGGVEPARSHVAGGHVAGDGVAPDAVSVTCAGPLDSLAPAAQELAAVAAFDLADIGDSLLFTDASAHPRPTADGTDLMPGQPTVRAGASEPAPGAVRWTIGLPDDPAPMRIGALRGNAAASAVPVAPASGAVPPAGSAIEWIDLGAGRDEAGHAEPCAPENSVDGLDPLPDVLGDVREVPGDAAGSVLDLSFEVAVPDAVPTAVPNGDLLAFDTAALRTPSAPLYVDLTDTVDVLAGEVPDVPAEAAVPEPIASAAAEPDADEPLDLGAWLRATTPAESPRMTTAHAPETGDEQADFAAALGAFTAGVARALGPDDAASHYDLGVAFREMGLLEEAVREFQCAAGATGGALREREALAQCFLDLGRPELALETLEQAAASAAASGTPGDALVGVHYVLAEAASTVGRVADARAWYVRVLAADYRFRDAASRLAALPPPAAPITAPR